MVVPNRSAESRSPLPVSIFYLVNWPQISHRSAEDDSPLPGFGAAHLGDAIAGPHKTPLFF